MGLPKASPNAELIISHYDKHSLLLIQQHLYVTGDIFMKKMLKPDELLF